MDEQMLNGTMREQRGTAESRRMRHAGMVPAVIYGHGEIQNIAVNEREIIKFLTDMGSENDIIALVVDGKKYNVLIKEVQRHVVSYNLLHIDFLVVKMEETVRVSVPVEAIGESIGIKTFGGLLDIVMREIEVECKAKDIPESIQLDVSALQIHDAIRIGDLPEVDGLIYIGDAATPIIVVAGHMEDEEVEEVEEGAVEPEVITAKDDTESE